MADTLTKTIKELLKTIKEFDKRKTSPYDTRAEVIRVNGNIAYVHIPGGVAETPVDMTVNAKAGDMVQVRVSGGRAWIIGNATAPPTDDGMAIQATNEARNANTNASRAKLIADKASDEAAEAYQFAGTAVEAANVANRAANSALESADTAHQAADAAVVSANEAKESARSANNSANNALVQLSVVEDVAGTLRWISEHGDYVLTTDNRVYSGTVYFIYQNGDYIPIASPDPSKNPSEEGWYVLDVTQSTTDYIMSHLAVTSYGLWVLPVNNLSEHFLKDSNGNLIIDSNGYKIVDFSDDPQHASGYKVLLSGGTSQEGFPIGLSIYNDEGESVAHYGLYTRIGAASGNHIYIDINSIDIKDGQNILATFGTETAIFSTDGTELAHFGYSLGTAESGTAVAPYYTLGTRQTTTTDYNDSETYEIGDLCIHDGDIYCCISDISTAEAWTSSHWTLAIGNYSNAEGAEVIASGTYSHAEGYLSKAISRSSHAEGNNTTAASLGAHAEGVGTQALGIGSHAQNIGTIAASNHQTAVGRYNVLDGFNRYAVIIGNGDSANSRSNALTVTWDGDVNCGYIHSKSFDSGLITASDIGSVPATDAVEYTLTFNKTFASAPVVVASLFSDSTQGSGLGSCTVTVHSVTTSGCKIKIFNNDTQARNPAVSWIAIIT